MTGKRERLIVADIVLRRILHPTLIQLLAPRKGVVCLRSTGWVRGYR